MKHTKTPTGYSASSLKKKNLKATKEAGKYSNILNVMDYMFENVTK